MQPNKTSYMNELKITPGFWQVMYSTPTHGESALAVWPATTKDGIVGSPICKVSPISLENETDRANAALIAAAPELLEALLVAEETIEHFIKETGQNFDNTMRHIKEAINKATTIKTAI